MFDFVIKNKILTKYGTKCRLYWIVPANDLQRIILKDLNFCKFFYIILEKKNSRFKCIVCKKEFLEGFAIVSNKKAQKFNISNWNWICIDCLKIPEIEISYKKAYNLPDIAFDLFQIFINMPKPLEKLYKGG